MKILVTGATGFLGRHVIRELAKTEHEIVATSRRQHPGLLDMPKSEKVRFISCNLNEERPDYRTFFGSPEAVIHLAWEGLPNYRELFHFERNLHSSYRFLKGLIQQGVRDITTIGTCLEYGIRNGPLSEEMISEPVTSYGLAKDTLRRFLSELKKKTDFNFRWIRLFYTFGDGQGENSLLEQLKKAIADGKPSFDMSPGDQLRDYLPIEAVARNIVRVALQTKVQGIINCCSGKPVSVREIAEEYAKSASSDIALHLGVFPYPDYEALAFWGDPNKLNLILNEAG